MTWVKLGAVNPIGLNPWAVAWDFIEIGMGIPTLATDPHWRLWFKFSDGFFVWHSAFWAAKQWHQIPDHFTQEFIALLSDEEKAAAMAAAINYQRRNAT